MQTMNFNISDIKTAVEAKYGGPSLVREYLSNNTVAVVWRTTRIKVPYLRIVSILSSMMLGLEDLASFFITNQQTDHPIESQAKKNVEIIYGHTFGGVNSWKGCLMHFTEV